MTIVQQVKDAIAKADHEKALPDELRRLSDFYAEMKRLGIAKDRTYDLPMLDTIGRTAHRTPKPPKPPKPE